MPGFTEVPHDFAIKSKFVNATRLGVRRVQVLCWPLRDANGPRLSLIRRVCGQIAQHGMARLVVGHVEEDEPLKVAVVIENLDAPVTAISDVNVVLPVNSNIVRNIELAGVFICMLTAGTSRSPGLYPVPMFVELGHPGIGVAIAHVQVVFAIEGDVGWRTEVSVHVRRCRTVLTAPPQPVAFEPFRFIRPFRPPSKIQGHVSCRIETHDSIRTLVHNPQIVVLVETRAVRVSQALHTMADFTFKLAGLIELQQLSGRIPV